MPIALIRSLLCLLSASRNGRGVRQRDRPDDLSTFGLNCISYGLLPHPSKEGAEKNWGTSRFKPVQRLLSRLLLGSAPILLLSSLETGGKSRLILNNRRHLCHRVLRQALSLFSHPHRCLGTSSSLDSTIPWLVWLSIAEQWIKGI